MILTLPWPWISAGKSIQIDHPYQLTAMTHQAEKPVVRKRHRRRLLAAQHLFGMHKIEQAALVAGSTCQIGLRAAI
jgi:hypothetical protein